VVRFGGLRISTESGKVSISAKDWFWQIGLFIATWLKLLALMSLSISGVKDFTVAFVPTTTYAGVSICPCAVVITPARPSRPNFLIISKLNFIFALPPTSPLGYSPGFLFQNWSRQRQKTKPLKNALDLCKHLLASELF
jgi:hypothetical protein